MKKKVLGLVYLLILLISFYALFVSWVEAGAKYGYHGRRRAAGIELALNWNNKAALFGSAFAALMVTAVTGGWRLAPVFVELISYLLAQATLQGLGEVLAGISQALTAAVALLFRSWIDVAEVLIGAGL